MYTVTEAWNHVIFLAIPDLPDEKEQFYRHSYYYRYCAFYKVIYLLEC